MKAALYLRSSKDRSDVSIDAQRRELHKLAADKCLTIVREFSDVVLSGKDDQRPGFQEMLSQLKKRDRAWDHLLALDTSRIARNQYLAHALHYECEKRNIKVLYAKVPETGSVIDVVIRSVMQSFDQLHSLMSKEKGLAGMAENVKQGFRAGGRAPYGYQLEAIATGAIREGEAVTKSRLILDDRSVALKNYLQLRALGHSRARAAKQAGLSEMASTSLLGMEWNALTYAGHTVWNVHNEKLSGGGYKGATKRRPRSEWVMQKDTHPALITTEEAEEILASLDRNKHKQTRDYGSGYLLSGLLFNSAGDPWHGSDGIYYRCKKGKRLKKEDIEKSLVTKIIQDLMSADFITSITRAARKAVKPISDSEIKPVRAEISKLTSKIAKATEMAMEATSHRPWLEQIEKLESERARHVERLDRAQDNAEAAKLLLAISEKQVEQILKDLTENLDHADPDAVKEFLKSVVEKIELTENPVLTCSIHYSIKTGDKMASPRGFEPRSPP